MNTIANFHYSDAEKKTILKSMIVLIDSQEKVNGHFYPYIIIAEVYYGILWYLLDKGLNH